MRNSQKLGKTPASDLFSIDVTGRDTSEGGSNERKRHLEWLGANVISLALATSLAGCSFLTGENSYFRDRSMDYQRAVNIDGYRLSADVSQQTLARINPVRPVPVVTENPERFEPESLDDVPRPQVIELVGAEGRLQIVRGFEARWLWLETDPASAYVWLSQYFNDAGFIIKAGSTVGQRLDTSWREGYLTEPPDEGFWARSVASVKSLGQSAAPHERYRVWFRSTSTSGLRGTRVVVLRQVTLAEAFSQLPVDWPAVLPPQTSKPLAMTDPKGFLDYPAGDWWADLVNILDGQMTEAADLAVQTQPLDGVVAQVREDGNGWPVLTIGQPFARSWDALGTALVRSKQSRGRTLEIEDLDRSLAVFYIKWTGDTTAAASSKKYQLHVAKGEQGVLVSVQLDDDTVAPKDESERVLSFIKEQLDGPGA
jgi:outer membrane protein assembly factor BamC